jgi:hypothetical protein
VGQPETDRYLWLKGNYCGLSSAVAVIDWDLEFAHLLVGDAYEMFLKMVYGLVPLYVPVSDGEIRAPCYANPPHFLKGGMARG